MLELDGVPLADMCLSFCVPGHDDVPLMEGGCEVTVTPQNVEEYIRCRLWVFSRLFMHAWGHGGFFRERKLPPEKA
jgi:hypothetical protein